MLSLVGTADKKYRGTVDSGGAILPIWENSGVRISQQKQFQLAAVVF